MGAEQSRQDNGNAASSGDVVTKTCYYDILGIERSATEDDIKKAYRRKALALHPDRNFGNVEHATKQFAEVQSAYQLLSDPHERAWYDSHREQILRGDDGGEKAHYDHNVKVTSPAELVSLMGRFSANIPFTDAPNGFYGVLRKTFEKLSNEEDAASEWQDEDLVDWPDFGEKDDDYEDVVRPFYAMWASFSTQKTYSWEDHYNLSEAPDRRIRRLMEQENKRLREEGRREFNDAVRQLVAFVRKRDPRYMQNVQSEQDRQKKLKEAAAAQAARARAANQATLHAHEVPEWARKTVVEEETGTFSDSELSENEIFECVACGKTFKSEKQYDAHEKSKKHIKIVQHLKRQMEKENRRLGLDVHAATPQAGSMHEKEASDEEENDLEGFGSSKPAPVTTESLGVQGFGAEELGLAEDSDSAIDDEYAPRKEIVDRLKEDLPSHADTNRASGVRTAIDDLAASSTSMSLANSSNDDSEIPKLGKAKLKKAKKAARQDVEALENGNVCAACDESFASKTKLFDHLRDNPKHAKSVGYVQTGRGGKKGKGTKK